MSNPLSTDQVKQVARLARLRLSDAEVERLAQQMGNVLGYVELLKEVDTTGVEPLAHAIDVQNVLRADKVTPSLPREAALANAPKSDDRYFLVPQILAGR